MYSKRLLCLLLLFFCIFQDVYSKVVRNHVSLQAGNENENWKYLSKFSFGIGEGNFTFDVPEKIYVGNKYGNRKLNEKKRNISRGTRFYLYLDEDWDKVKDSKSCKEKVSLAKWYSNKFNDIVWPLEHTVSQSIRPHIWYFAIADCDEYEQPIVPSSIDYVLGMKNTDKTHFSYEDRIPAMVMPYLATFSLLALCFLCYQMVRYNQSTKQTFLSSAITKTENRLTVHPTLRNLVFGTSLFFCATVLEYLHLRMYSQDGEGMKNYFLFAEICQWCVGLVVSLELVSISWMGYFSNGRNGDMSPTKKEQKNSQIFKYVTGGLIVFHLLVVILGRHYEDAHYRSNYAETIYALALIFIHLSLYISYIVGLYYLYTKERVDMTKDFIVKLGIYGSLYFICTPLVIFSACFFAQYLRHQIVSLGTLAVQSIALSSVARLFLTRNDFTKLSSLAYTGEWHKTKL